MIPVAGSERPSLGIPVAPVDPNETVQVSVVVDDRRTSASVLAVTTFAADAGLRVDDITRSTVHLSGTAADMAAAFGTQLDMYEVDGRRIRGRSGPVHVPAELNGHVVAVFGLDNRPAAKPYFRPAAASVSSLTALQVAAAYNFPASTGTGQTVGIVELGGGYKQSDLSAFFGGLGLPVPNVTAVGVLGATNVPGGDPNGADGEVELDIEVAGAVAPAASFRVYFAPNTDAGFLAAIEKAATECDIISISWGQAESQWTAQSLTAFDLAFQAAAKAGVSVFVAAGDTGADDSTGTLAADFPGTSPSVTCCGGTRLVIDSTGIRSAETVWDDNPTSDATGGGYSTVFSRPTYQSPSVGQWRGVPDIAGNADPNSGYHVTVDGQALVIGGTSAVAPLMAGLTARLNSLTRKRVGLLNTVAYTNPAAFYDITSGSNGGPWSAGTGWDATSGLGVPNGGELLAALGTTAPPPPPVSPPPVTPPTPAPPTPVPPAPAPTGDGNPFRDAVGSHPGLLAHLTRLAVKAGKTVEQWAADHLAHEYPKP